MGVLDRSGALDRLRKGLKELSASGGNSGGPVGSTPHGRCLAELTHGRLHADGVVGPGHPFETTAVAMQRRLRQLTGITITPPLRATDVPAPPDGGR